MSNEQHNFSDEQTGAGDTAGDDTSLEATLGAASGSLDTSAGYDGEYVAESSGKSLNKTTIVMFTVFALGAAGVWFMITRTGPSSAGAAVVKEQQAAKQTINNFLGNNGESIRLMERMLKDTEKVVQQFLTYPSMNQIPLTDLRTNPFRARAAAAAGADNGVNEKRRREEERLAMLKSVQGLQLQSIMCSDTRRACMINNAMYRENQQVDAFTIEKITTTSVVVKNGSYRFELRMAR